MRVALLGPVSLQMLGFSDVSSEGYRFPFTALLARKLVELGHEVVVMTTDPAASVDSEHRNHDGLILWRTQQRTRARDRALDWFRAERKGISRGLNRFRPDIVHAHWTYEFALAAIHFDARRTLVTAHDAPWAVLRYLPDMYRAIRLSMAINTIPRIHHATAVSPYVARHLRKYCGLRVYPFVIPNAVPDALVDENALPDSERKDEVIAVLSEWSRLKNGQALLMAWADVCREFPDWRLRLVGAGCQVGGPGHSWALSRNLVRQVTFHGRATHSEVLSAMRNAKLLVHPSLLECNPMTLIEALACGTPIVAGRYSGGTSWTVGGEQAARLVDVTSKNEMAHAIRTLMEDHVSREKLRERGRGLANERYRLSTVAKLYENAYCAVN